MSSLLVARILVCFLFLVPAQEVGASDEGGPPDLRKVLARAKSTVFPALIYVAPVVEEFSQGRREKREQGGSGVIISPDGHVVTNWHVVESAVSIRVLLSDGTFLSARKIGQDRETDLGLLKLEGGEAPFPYAELGDSRTVEQGEFVIAMGAPWGLSRSISLGIVSSTRRYLKGQSEYSLWIQTDASINPGNSGGPLVDTSGRVVGINTLGSRMGGDLGFAIPAGTVRRIVGGLREHGEMRRAWTGLHLQPLRDFESNSVFDSEVGVLVASVDPGSPADEAGLEVGDLILRVAGRSTNGLYSEDLPAVNVFFASLPVDDPVEVETRRGQEGLTRVLVPRAKGSVEGEDLELSRWNLTVKAINEFEHPALHFYQEEGVFVQGVREPGNASEAGLRMGDIIVKISGREVVDLVGLKQAYEEEVADESREPKVLFEILRGGYPRQLVLDYSKRYLD